MTALSINVTPEDLEAAESFAKRQEREKDTGYRSWHNWMNPLAIAIERCLNHEAYASVSPRFLGIAFHRGGPGQKMATTPEIDVYLREWCRGVAQPQQFNLTFE